MMLGEFDSSNTEKSVVVSCAAIAEMEDSATNARKARVMCTHNKNGPPPRFWAESWVCVPNGPMQTTTD